MTLRGLPFRPPRATTALSDDADVARHPSASNARNVTIGRPCDPKAVG
jgi:hypothetical protein